MMGVRTSLRVLLANGNVSFEGVEETRFQDAGQTWLHHGAIKIVCATTVASVAIAKHTIAANTPNVGVPSAYLVRAL